MDSNFRSGFVSIIGRPNVGKSTLLNRIVGEKLAIVSNKPQTTRNKIRGILTTTDFQMVFIDTPGIHRPKSRLGELMVKTARSAVSEVDAVLFLISAPEGFTDGDRLAAETLKNIKTPVFLVINKLDAVKKPDILRLIDEGSNLRGFDETIPVSALDGENVDGLISQLQKRLPPGPKYFPDDMTTDQPERFIAAEIIREKALRLLQDEIPHGVAVEIISSKKRGDRNLIDMEANIYCEKESHKPIVIGKNGEILKKIGISARQEIENLFSSSVNLQLWVKVKKNWRDSNLLAASLGGLRAEK